MKAVRTDMDRGQTDRPHGERQISRTMENIGETSADPAHAQCTQREDTYSSVS